MKVKILVSIAGQNFSYYPGQIVDLKKEEALQWIEGGNAERISDSPDDDQETAMFGKLGRKKKDKS